MYLDMITWDLVLYTMAALRLVVKASTVRLMLILMTALTARLVLMTVINCLLDIYCRYLLSRPFSKCCIVLLSCCK